MRIMWRNFFKKVIPAIGEFLTLAVITFVASISFT